MQAFLTASESAERLRCSVSTIYRLIHGKKLPIYKVNDKTLIKVEELDALVIPVDNLTPRNPWGSRGKPKTGTSPNLESRGIEEESSLTKSPSPQA